MKWTNEMDNRAVTIHRAMHTLYIENCGDNRGTENYPGYCIHNGIVYLQPTAVQQFQVEK